MVTIILASSIAIPAIGFAISQVLNALHDKPHLVEYDQIVALRDEKGQPVCQTVKRHKLLEPRKENRQNKFEANFDLTNGIVMKFKTKEGA